MGEKRVGLAIFDNLGASKLLVSYKIRKATLCDCDSLTMLIARSVRQLGATDYSVEQIEAALRNAFGLDTQLILDQTYFVVESEGQIVGCGGWSYRSTLFGSDNRVARDAAELNPRVDAAKIRAFFVAPAYARQGIGSMILKRCEQEAQAFGFTHLELLASLPGVRLYTKHGYLPSPAVQYELAPGLNIEFVPMTKVLSKSSEQNLQNEGA